MRKDTSARLFLFFLLLSPELAKAQVVNEILYSPSSKQWVEIYNNSSNVVDLSQYKILDNAAATNGHAISACSGALGPGGYALVAKVPDDFLGSAFVVCKSSLGIKTTGDTVKLKLASYENSFQFSDGAASSGNSLQRQSDGTWVATTPTPGAINGASSSGGSSSNSGASDQSTSTTTDTGTNQSISTLLSAHYSFVPVGNDPMVKFSVSAGRERLGATKQALVFKAMANTDDPNTSYFWNFGDGSTDQGREVSHAYALAGDYAVVLNAVLFDNQAVSRTRVKVIEPNLVIAEETLDYVALQNKSAFEINLYGWEFIRGTSVFRFPKDTIIDAGAVVKFARAILKLDKGVTLSRIAEAVPGSAPVKLEVVAQTPPKNVEEIQALADKLVALKAELAEMKKPQAVTDNATSPETAAVTEALPPASVSVSASSSWRVTLKHFFLR